MEVGKSHASSFSSVPYSWTQFLIDRSIIFLVLLSMSIQLILVLGGTIRYRTISRLLNFIVWMCYMGADFVATSALGAMIHYSTRSILYAVWACVLIVHLGGPDTITAYSIPDSNLWRRHCFGMVYQGLIAAYVVYVSAVEGGTEMEWHLLGAASLIFIVGITKYAERAWALRLASPSQIVSSVKPIHNYMKIEHALGLHIDEHIPNDEIADVDKYREGHEDNVRPEDVNYQYIVAGEECLDEDKNNGNWSKGIVTINDVWEHEAGAEWKEKAGDDVTDNFILCVSHALFKMYKRRFASLRFHEAALRKTERFFCEGCFNNIQVFNVLEIELKFLYDYLFSKSSGTAFSGWGVGMRMVNISLLGICWFLIMRGLQETADVVHGQRTVTYILMSVALGLEVFQLGRIVVSDWSMVWLICASIRQSRKQSESWCCSSSTKLIEGVTNVVERVRKVVGGSYWQNQIPQLCVIESCFNSGRYNYRLIKKAGAFLPLKEIIMKRYIREVRAWHTETEFVDEDSKKRILADLRQLTSNNRQQLSGIKDWLKGHEEAVGWEHLILALHVGTTVMEKLEDESKIEDEKVKSNIRWSVTMSRYFAYLLVSCPDILPVDAENAKMIYRQLFEEIMGKISEMGENATIDDFCKNFRDCNWGESGSPTLRFAKRVLTQSVEGESWNWWADLWLWMLYMCGMYDKSGEHGKRITVGGEFLTQVWVLMGHLGRGEEWYSPTAMKRDPRQWDGEKNDTAQQQ